MNETIRPMPNMEPKMDQAPGQSLDPFEFHGHPASCIAGLGGSAPLPDPAYAFHTGYVPVARGHAHFRVRFTNLQARRGSLVLRVHMLPNAPGAVAQLVTSHRLQLNWLAHHGGEAELRFEAFRGARYSLMGVVPDQLDASADELSVTLDRPATEADSDPAGNVAESQSTAYGSETIRSVPVSLLLSLDPPSFAQPVSQPCTVKQLGEPALRARLKPLGDGPAGRAECWQIAYALQALERYGMLQAGARGLILGDAPPSLIRALADAGTTCEQVALRPEGGGGGSLKGGAGSAIDPDALPGDLFAFDFLLSVRSTDTLGDDKLAASFIERAMECLRPSGLAVHVVGHHPDPAALPFVVFDRNGLERIALSLISRGHQVARMKPPLAQLGLEVDAAGAVPFGLIVRRAQMIR